MAIRARRSMRASRRGDSVELGIPGYKGGSLLGQGSFGSVYLARQTAFDRPVAIKVLAAPVLSEETKARFERECMAIGALSGHPHIVTVYDSGITKAGRAYIAMDHLPGGSLADRVAADGPLDWIEALQVGIKIAGAIETAHRAGVLHRDIKPENILISDYGEPKLADFGVSTIPGAYQTADARITGTIAHAAPEILEGQRASEASDRYSLASTIFQLIDGRAPFVRSDDELLQATIARILREEPPDLKDRGVSESGIRELERALSKDPLRRHRSAEAFGAALQVVVAGAGAQPAGMVLPDARADEAPVLTGPVPVESRTVDRTLRRVAAPGVPRWQEPAAETPRSTRLRVALLAAAIALVLAGGSVVTWVVLEEAPPVEAVYATNIRSDTRTAKEVALLGRAARSRAEQLRRERLAEIRERRAELRRKRRLAALRRRRQQAAAPAPAPAAQPAPAPAPAPPPEEDPPREKPPNEQPPPN